MTRCYEFYCAYEHNPKFCVDKGDRIVDYIEEYIAFMRTKGIEFDKSPTDKARFVSMQEKYGSERTVTQGNLTEKDVSLPIETQHVADTSSKIPTEIKETSEIQPPLPLKSVESCPDGICHTTIEEFKGNIGVQYKFTDCACKSCSHNKECFSEMIP